MGRREGNTKRQTERKRSVDGKQQKIKNAKVTPKKERKRQTKANRDTRQGKTLRQKEKWRWKTTKE